MASEEKRKGAPRRSFVDLEVEQLVDEYKQIPDELMMAVDRGFTEVMNALSKKSFFNCGGMRSSRDCLDDVLHKKLQAFSKVVEHRKVWYARLQVIKSKDPKRLNVLERQALKLSEMDGREAYIQLQKALKACVEADENAAKTIELAKRLENRATSLQKRSERGTSSTAEHRARTAWLCFLGSTFETAVKIVGYEPISFLEAVAEKANNPELFSLLDNVKKDKRNKPS